MSKIDPEVVADQLEGEVTDGGAGQATIGRPLKRKEDARLITGQTRWTDNIVLPGMLHAAVLRSPMAHARITSLDVSAAKERPNVIDVFTAADLEGDYGPLP
jgi:aerobic carbon-monoxide dehydrogenase large subunit